MLIPHVKNISESYVGLVHLRLISLIRMLLSEMIEKQKYTWTKRMLNVNRNTNWPKTHNIYSRNLYNKKGSSVKEDVITENPTRVNILTDNYDNKVAYCLMTNNRS